MATFILVSQLVMTMAGWGYLKVTTPEIVVFDMKGTIDLFKEQSARQSLDEEKAQRLTRRFNTALTDSLGDWQSSHNAILLVKPAVISEQTDITQEIRADIARRMQEGQ
ncbi:type-F conjugative transfer system protein TrbI [Atlantibacter hermannii]|uniref:type-F conjugative transfer system protein TrbI n=1 Tax=Atlantibacter hermannii TaxID=565 RepID=UPI0035E41A32